MSPAVVKKGAALLLLAEEERPPTKLFLVIRMGIEMPFPGLMGSRGGHGKEQLLSPTRQRDLEVADGGWKRVGGPV